MLRKYGKGGKNIHIIDWKDFFLTLQRFQTWLGFNLTKNPKVKPISNNITTTLTSGRLMCSLTEQLGVSAWKTRRGHLQNVVQFALVHAGSVFFVFIHSICLVRFMAKALRYDTTRRHNYTIFFLQVVACPIMVNTAFRAILISFHWNILKTFGPSNCPEYWRSNDF